MAGRSMILRILGDPSGGVRAVKQQAAALQQLNAVVAKSSDISVRSVNAQIAAAGKRDARLREEIQLYKAASAAAVQGSREQIAAANLATRAERKLAGAHRSADRELGRGIRGALAGAGVFRALGRSIAFASGGFLIFATASNALRTSVDAARQAAATQRQLAAQFRVTGQPLAMYRNQIEETTAKVSRLAAFHKDDLTRAFITAYRQSENVNVSLKIQALAADVARGRGIGLALAALALTKAYGGQTTALRRLGVLVPGHTKGMAALNFVEEKFRGQMVAGRTATERFGSALFNTEEVVGTALLPTIDKLANKLANWLDVTKNQVELQKSLQQLVSGTSTVLGAFADAIGLVNDALGGWRNTLVDLTFVWVAFKVQGIIAAQVVAAQNVLAAGITKSAWRAALISTGWGALAVAAGLAAGYVITHWKKVKAWFRDFQIFIKQVAIDMLIPFKYLGAGGAIKRLELQKAYLQDQQMQQQGAPGTAAGGYKPLYLPGLHGGPIQAPLTFKMKIADVELKLAQAQLTAITADDRALLVGEAKLIQAHLKTIVHARGTLAKRTELTNKLVGINSQIAAIDKDNADAQTSALKDQQSAAEDQLQKLKQLKSTLESKIKSITDAFQGTVSNVLSKFGALGQGPLLAPSQSAVKGILGVPGVSAGLYVRDLRAQTAAGQMMFRNISKIQADVTGTKGTSASARARRTLRAKLGVDLQDLPPEELAALAAHPAEARAFISAYAQRQKLATRIAKVEMRAQLVTLHATRIQLAAINRQISGHAQVVNHIKVEIDGKDVKPKKVTSTATTTTQRRGRAAGVKAGTK